MRRWPIILGLVAVVFFGYARADKSEVATEVATIDPNDGDGDGFSEGYEFTYIGTAPGLRCEPEDYLPGRVEAWPPDFNRDNAVTGADLSAMAARIGTMVDYWTPQERRFDIGDEPMGDAAITGSDLSAVAGRIGTTC